MKKIYTWIINFIKKLFSNSESEKLTLKFYPNYQINSLDVEIILLINTLRTENNREILVLNNDLCNVAASHSNYMAKELKMSHDFAVERQNQFPNNKIGENVAVGYKTEKSILAAWKKSPGHYEVMNSTRYKSIGVATAKDVNGKIYVTALFMD